jgi:hypothetical protein
MKEKHLATLRPPQGVAFLNVENFGKCELRGEPMPGNGIKLFPSHSVFKKVELGFSGSISVVVTVPKFTVVTDENETLAE